MTTLSDGIDRYLKIRAAKHAKTTVRGDIIGLRRMLAQVGNVQVTGVNRDHMTSYWYGAKGRVNQVSAASFNAERARIVSFFNWLVEEGEIPASPMRGIDRRRVGSRERLRLDSAAMIELIEGETYPRDRMLLSLGCNLGLRAHALTPITVGDVDLDGGWIRTYTSKTDDQRILPISLDLDRELRLWLEAYAAACGPLRPDWFLTPARHRGLGTGGTTMDKIKPNQQMLYTTALRIVHIALARIGQDEKGAGTHTLRRSSGRVVYETARADGDPTAIHVAREFLGHRNVGQTEVYVGTSNDKHRLEQAMRGKAFLSRKSGTSDNNVISLSEMRRRKNGG